MSVSLEKIDLLRNRVNTSYEEAKAALEKTNGDLVEALIYFEKENKTKPEEKKAADFASEATGFIKSLIQKGNNTRLIIKKEDKDIINLSMTVSVIGGVLAPYIPLVGIPLAVITKHKVRIVKSNGEDMKINKVIDKVSETVTTTVDSIVNQSEKQETKEEVN